VITLNKLRTCLHSIIRTLLRWEGMDEREVRLATLVEAWAIVEAIRRGETAAAILWEPYVSYVERVFGWRVLAEGRTVIAPSNYGFALYARRSLLVGEPGLVLGMLEAYAESVRAAQRDVGAAAATVRNRIPDVLPEDVDKGLAREAPHWSADISLDSGFLQRVTGELEVQTVIPERFELAEHVAEVPRAA
jgi:ABC-type nitrate/sulfonate/bicarbonate transport system substrate-binding protein